MKKIFPGSPLLLAFWAEKSGTAGHGFLGNGCRTAITGLALLAICLQFELEIAAFAAFVDKVAYCRAAAFNSLLQNMFAACHDSCPFLHGEPADLFSWIYAGMEKDLAGINIAYTGNLSAVHQKIF